MLKEKSKSASTATTNKSSEKSKKLRRNEKKWTESLMKAGWTVIPSILLEQQDKLGLNPIDMNIILQLASFWWYDDNPPHPSKKRIATRLSIDPSTVRRHVAAMELKGYIKRKYRNDEKKGQQTNEYVFDGLIKAALPYAKEALGVKRKYREENDKRVNRTRRTKKTATEN